MSFQLSNVKYKSHKQNIQYNIKECFMGIKHNDLLTENVKYALSKYVDYRFTKRNCKNLNYEQLLEMIKGLLEFVVGKNYTSISIVDVNNNESQILYEIKKAILNGATKTLYYDMTDKLQENYEYIITKDIPKLTKNELQDKQSIVDYFKDAVIL